MSSSRVTVQHHRHAHPPTYIVVPMHRPDALSPPCVLDPSYCHKHHHASSPLRPRSCPAQTAARAVEAGGPARPAGRPARASLLISANPVDGDHTQLMTKTIMNIL